MFTILFRSSATAITFLALSAPILAENLTPVEVAKKGKSAMALVLSKSKSGFAGFVGGPPGGGPPGGFGAAGRFSSTTSTYAPAFCIHPSGLFLTTYANASSISAQVIINPGLQTHETATAQVVRTDKDADLALLWVPSATTMSALPIGAAKDLRAAEEVVACGFPKRSLSTAASSSVVIKSGHVIASDNNQPGGHLRISVNPGGSGGPVLDLRGQVIGMILAENKDEALAASCERLRQFLTAPVLLFAAPTVTAENVHKPVEFQARVIDLFPAAKPAAFELDLLIGGDEGSNFEKQQQHKMTYKDGVYRAVAVPRAAPKEKPLLKITLTFADGTVFGSIADQAIQVDGKACPLSSLRSLQNKLEQTSIRFADGRTVAAKPSELPTLAVAVAGTVWDLDLSKATDIRIQPSKQTSSIACAVVARVEGKEALRWQQRLAIVSENTNTESTNADPEVLAVAQRMMELAFPRADANGDGKIAKHEATASVAAQFQRWDRDGDGLLTQQEYLVYVISVYQERYTAPNSPFSKKR